MKVYTLINSSIIFANSDKEFIEAVNTLTLKAKSINSYMKEFSSIIKSIDGTSIRINSPELFVQDLKKHKLLSVELPN